MTFQIGLIIITHLLLTGIFVYYIYSGKTHLRIEQVLFILFIPIFGPMAAFVIEQMNVLKIQGATPISLEPLGLENDILWATLKSFHENSNIVPLEEAILINDVKVRRRIMLETLYSDPRKYLDILNIAKYNDDIETSHYATTTIAKTQKDFQLSIQRLGVAVENNPGDESVLDEYLDVVEEYIESGLLEEHLVRNLRIVYSNALDVKLERSKGVIETYIKKARNCTKLGEYDLAIKLSDFIISSWPNNENSWIESIRICVESGDGNRLREILSKIKGQKIYWTKEGKESVNVWIKEFSYEA